MNNVVPTFPLLRLPKPAILNTMRTMTHIEIFGISILSKTTKNLVESLKLKTNELEEFHVFLTACFKARLNFPNNSWLCIELYHVGENEPPQELETPENIYIINEYTTVKWKNVMSVKQLINHLKLIFHVSINLLCFGPNCERFSIESVHRNVRNFQSMFFRSENHEHMKRTLSVFQPAALSLANGSLEDGRIPRYISIQNFDGIRALSVQITLDDLLLINARTIMLTCDRLSIEIFNRFFKLWTKGTNPQLEHLFIEFHSIDFQKEELLKGLKYQCAPLNRRRFIKVSDLNEPLVVIGGWDFCRLDGPQATISIDIKGDLVRFELFVWHDHCVVN